MRAAADKLFSSAILAFAIFNLVAIEAHADPRCEELFSRNINRVHNAEIAAEDYPFEHTRTTGDYAFFLGPVYRESYFKLQPGDVTIDLGGGLGLAHLQTAVARKT